ncbi:hypothetical protein [Actinomadura sediminis]|uniref:Asl1-like glycosyl hydrolase catalytic domain-containing protein n=1 Tax=Actinomadura sediminis TaxID=1038904 RepID=A0ABW3EJ35_9ACTN
MFERPTRRHKWALAAAVGAAALIASALPQAAAGQAPEDPLSRARVQVDFRAREGRLLHTERLNNFANPSVVPERRTDDAAFLSEQGLHADIHRVWMDDDADEGTAHADLCVVETNTCDFSPVAAYLRDAAAMADSLLVVPMPTTLIGQRRPPAETKAILKMIIKGLKERHPKIEYIEAFNEPDMHFYGAQVRNGREPVLRPEELYSYYVPVYEVVNEVNRELKPRVPLKVGGPALTSLNDTWMKAFLDGYANDRNPGKRLDFISYHGYGEFDEKFQKYHFYKGNPSEVRTQRARLDRMLADRGIKTNIPAFITESGIYPGPAFDDAEGTTDYVRQAAGMASLHYWYSKQPETYPFNWVVRHGSNAESRKDQLVTPRPQPGMPIPADTFTPYGNMMLMQSKMKATRVKAASDGLDAGQGVYALASMDKTGASLMVWNYQHINRERFRARIAMSHLPARLRHGPVHQRMYRVDQTTSNYFADPAKAELQLVDERTVDLGEHHTESIDLEPNAIYLILLEPA